MLRRNVTFCFLLCGLSQINLAQAAPSIPKMLTENGLTYCTNASGFSFNPQTADAGTSMNVVTEQIYNKLFDIKDHSAALVPVLPNLILFHLMEFHPFTKVNKNLFSIR